MIKIATGTRGAYFLVIGLLGLILFPGGSLYAGNADDFFSVTVNTNLRAVPGSATAGTLPGFNPCPGDTTTGSAVGTICTPPAGSSALLAPSNIGTSCSENVANGLGTCKIGLFEQLGPGAVTDNMFGMITAPANPAVCTPRLSATVATSPVGLNLGLNCGDLHFDAASQGQNIPVEGNPLSGQFVSSTTMQADFSPNADAHTGFNFSNSFTWDPTCKTSAGVSQAVCITATQSVMQVTNLVPGGAGTFAAPGTGDQVFQSTGTFSLTGQSSDPTKNTAASDPTSSGPLITWTQVIQDPEQSGTAAIGFSQNLAGTFTYNQTPGLEFGCPAGPTTQGCSQYPNGQSQTLRSTGAASAAETLP